MKEIEVKILGIGHEKLEARLFELGAEKVFDGVLDAVFFDTVNSKVSRSGNTFRIRTEGEKVDMTYKQKLSSNGVAKIREETEFEVSSFEDAKKLVLLLGYKIIDGVKKRRVSYKLGDVKFEFDDFLGEYSFVPEFMEIEAGDEDMLYRHAEMLGFSREDCLDWTGKEVIDYYENLKK